MNSHDNTKQPNNYAIKICLMDGMSILVSTDLRDW